MDNCQSLSTSYLSDLLKEVEDHYGYSCNRRCPHIITQLNDYWELKEFKAAAIHTQRFPCSQRGVSWQLATFIQIFCG